MMIAAFAVLPFLEASQVLNMYRGNFVPSFLKQRLPFGKRGGARRLNLIGNKNLQTLCLLVWYARSVLDLLLNKHFKENMLQAILECILTVSARGFPRGSVRRRTIICISITQSLSGFFLSCFSIRNLGGRRGHSNVCSSVVGKAVVLIWRQ